MAFERITVIGGSGFVGTNFCQHLADNDIEFEIIDLKQSRRFPARTKIADIRDMEALRAAMTGDCVVHLAAVHRDDVRDRSEYYSTNADGTANIAAVCAQKDIRSIIFASTVAVYGFAPAGTGEDGPINPFNDYGRSKFQGEEKLRAWYRQDPDRLSLAIIRPTVIFGPGNRGNVYNLLHQIASGRFVMIGNGKNRKSMAYIGNVTAFLRACLDAGPGYAVYNYVDTPDMTMNDLVSQVRETLANRRGTGIHLPYAAGLGLGYLADLVSAVSGKNLPISSIRVKKFCATTQFSSAKESLAGFRPPYSLAQGLEQTLEDEFIHPDPAREVFYTE
ncbi:MAG TPA: NAD-dependent epimerase/dehydratase family protein [Aliiroseovarius sp.]|nr:NAD-dependent epimerase/dehydratase family protein [Aliiroseovarius sp.]